MSSFLFCVSYKDKFFVYLHFSILLSALMVSFPSVLVSSFPHTSLLTGSQHDYSLEPNPELKWSSLQPRGVAVTMIEIDRKHKALHFCEPSLWLPWAALWHKAIALKEAKGIDTTSRMLPAAYPDARQDFFLASPGNSMGSPNLAHRSFSVSTVYTIQI